MHMRVQIGALLPVAFSVLPGELQLQEKGTKAVWGTVSTFVVLISVAQREFVTPRFERAFKGRPEEFVSLRMR